MRAAATALALIASSVAAERYQFGQAWVEWDGQAVTFHNGLTSSMHYPADFYRDLTNGFTVRVVIMQGMGNAPDTMAVIPPAGYVAIPESVTVEEHEIGVIHVYLEGLS
jgi:hypothetical protein